MHWNLVILCLALYFIEDGLTRVTPDFIHPCPIDNRTCLIQSTKDALPMFSKGLPELGVPSLDPFIIDRLSIPLPGLKVSFYNGKVTGFRKAVIENVESNFKKHKFTVEFRSNITLKGAYEAVGRILTFPINGEGDAKIKITNLKMKAILTTQIKQDENGVNHFGVKSYKYTHDFGDKATFNLTNLFKGNPELSETVLVFLNQNWRIVAEEFGQPIFDFATDLAVKTIEKFFLAVPFEELVDGPIPSFD